MKKKIEELTISAATAVPTDGIDAEKEAAVSKPHTGGEGFDAESEKEAEFERLISGEYKKEFGKKVSKIISRRLKEVKEVRDENEKNAQIIKMLMEKYDITDADTQKLERMIKTDMNRTNNLQEKNTELIKRLIAENTYLKKNREAELRLMRERAQAQKLRAQVEETKKTYSDFDLEKEIKNPEFARLLSVGVSVKNAYEVTNIDKILDKNSRDAERQVVNSIRAKAVRPVENGSSPTSGVILSSDISKLTKKQRAELAKRAAKGERIEF